MKAKLDKQALQDFFLRHVEKMVFALILVGFMAFVYGAATGDRYPYPPERLSDGARRAQDNIQKTPASKGEMKIVDYVQIADQARHLVSAKPFALATLLDNPVFPQPIFRSEPKIFAVRDLIGSAELGAFTLHVAERAENRGQRWIVITGVVPVAEQAEAYAEAFRGNHMDTDVPQYYHYWVERAVVSADATEEPKWTQINVMDALKRTQQVWSAAGREVVPSMYLVADRPERLVFPLGPRVDGPWTEKVAHPPEITLSAPAPTPTPTPNAAPAARPDMPRPDMPPSDLPPLPGATATTETPAPASPAAAAAAAAVDESVKSSTAAANVQNLLFRFFDFDVKPGVSYRYRVKLLLLNPNFGVEVRRLKDIELAKKKTIESDWSDPTPAITVPRDDRMRLVSVKPSLRSDPIATVLVMKWLADTGAQVSENLPATRGQLLDFKNRPIASAEEGSGGGGGGLLGGGSSSRSKPSGRQVNYEVGMLLLDMRGGEKLPGRDQAATEPADALLLDSDGNLVVRSELDALAEGDRVGTAPAAPAPGGEEEPAPSGGGLLNLNP